jgi:acyl carrier protein
VVGGIPHHALPAHAVTFTPEISTVPPDVQRAVREILSDITLKDDCLRYPDDTLLETIGVDSVRMIELIYALEDRFAIQIADDEAGPENFSSIGSLAALIARKCP